MTKIKESFSMQRFVSIVCVLEKVCIGDKVVGSATSLIYKQLDIVMREINRAATVNKYFLHAETKAVFLRNAKWETKNNFCLGFRTMFDMIGDCPEKHGKGTLFYQRKALNLFCLSGRGQDGTGNSKKHVRAAI